MHFAHKPAGKSLIVLCIAVSIAFAELSCSAQHLSTLTYDGLIDAILNQSSAVQSAKREYELAKLKSANSSKLWNPDVNVSGVLNRFDVVKGSHAQSVALSLSNKTAILGGTTELTASTTYEPSAPSVNLRNQLSVSFSRSLTTGGIDSDLAELRAALADCQADKAYADRINELVSQGVAGLSAVVKHRNGLITSAVRLELAAFNKEVADEKFKLGAISASSLAEAQDSLNSATKTYFDNLSVYRDKLWELSRDTGLPEISDDSIDNQLVQARDAARDFLRLPASDGEKAEAAARELLSTLRQLVLLPDATVRNVNDWYEQRVAELENEDNLLGLPAMRIRTLDLEIQRLTLEKSERNLGWKVDASASASWADFKPAPDGGYYIAEPNVEAAVAVTFQKQLLGSSLEESRMELEINRAKLESEAATALTDFSRQLANLRRTVEDKEYAREAARQSLQDSIKLWEFTVSKYAAGMATGTDVLTAALSLLEAESAFRSADIDCVYAKLRYLNAIGELLY